MSSAPVLKVSVQSEEQRSTLADWRTQLEKLVTHQRACRSRAVHGDLGRHLSSSIRGAQESIREACTSAASEMVATAAQHISGYFRHMGDARQAAAIFPAFHELNGFLRGWKCEETLAGLADQAATVAAIITKLLAGEILWKFEGSAE